MIDLKTGDIIKTFKSISDAGRQMKISSGNIGMVCRGHRNQAGGYLWEYSDKKLAQKYAKDIKQVSFEFA